MFLDEVGDARAVGMLQRFGPLMPVTAVLLGQRAPRGEVIKRAPLPGTVRSVGQLPARRPWHSMDELERRALGRPRAVAVDGVLPIGPFLQVRAQLAHPRTLG